MTLLPAFLHLIQQWRPCFADYRTHRRAVGFALSLLVCLLTPHHQSRHLCARAAVSQLGFRLPLVLHQLLESS
jgi:hypothetical protein